MSSLKTIWIFPLSVLEVRKDDLPLVAQAPQAADERNALFLHHQLIELFECMSDRKAALHMRGIRVNLGLPKDFELLLPLGKDLFKHELMVIHGDTAKFCFRNDHMIKKANSQYLSGIRDLLRDRNI